MPILPNANIGKKTTHSITHNAGANSANITPAARRLRPRRTTCNIQTPCSYHSYHTKSCAQPESLALGKFALRGSPSPRVTRSLRGSLFRETALTIPPGNDYTRCQKPIACLLRFGISGGSSCCDLTGK